MKNAKRPVRDFLIMLAAWPLGVACAFVWLFIPSSHASCPPGEACELHSSSLLSVLAWLCRALGPGVFATVRWWRGTTNSA